MICESPDPPPNSTLLHDYTGHDHDFREASRRSLTMALILISGYMLVEVVGGVLSGSLALIADVGHMLTDAAAIGLALIAMWLAGKAASTSRTFGFQRTEVLAAMVNALALWLIAAWIVFEAFERLLRHQELEVEGGLMLGVGVGGLIVNLIATWILHASSEDSLNVQKRVPACYGRPAGVDRRDRVRPSVLGI